MNTQFFSGGLTIMTIASNYFTCTFIEAECETNSGA